MSITARDVTAIERDCYGLDGDPDASICSACGTTVYRDDGPHTVADCLATLRREVETMWVALRVLKAGGAS